MRNVLIWLSFLFLFYSFGLKAELTTPPKSIEQPYFYLQNQLKNPGFELGKTGWSASAGSYTITTTTANVGTGQRAGEFDASAASQTLTSSAITIPAGWFATNGVAYCKFKTAASDYEIQAWDGSTVIEEKTIPVSNTYARTSVNFVIPSSGTIALRINSNSNAAAIDLDDCYIGLADNISGSGIMNDWNNTLSFTTSNFGTISANNFWTRRVGDSLEVRGSFIAGTTVAATASLNLPSGYTINTSALTAGVAKQVGIVERVTSASQSFAGSANGPFLVFYDGTTNNSLFIALTSSSSDFVKANANSFSSGEKVDFYFTIPISGWSSGAAYYQDQADYGWTSYTPTTQGFGTPSNVECLSKRDSQDLLVRCKLTLGTRTAAEARVGFPTGLTSASTTLIPTLQKAGDVAWSGTTTVAYHVYIEPSVTYFTFGFDNGGGLTKQNGNAVFGDATTISFIARVPISGWQQTSVPALVNSVISSYTGVTRTEIAKLNCDSSSAITSQHGSWISSIGNVSAGACVVTLTSGMFSSTPYCTIADTNVASDPITLSVNATSTTSVTMDCADNAGTDCTAYDVTLQCMGAK